MISPELVGRIEQCAAVRSQSRIRIVSAREVSGGCINRAACLTFSDNSRAFLKWHSSPPADFFRREAEGLETLADASPLRIPAVLGFSEGESQPGFLLLEDLTASGGSSRPDRTAGFDEELGQGLAAQHHSTAHAWGFRHDNYIGTTLQANGQLADWPDFFRTRRLQPLLELLSPGADERRPFDRLLGRLDQLIATEEPPALLHGDLWTGNILSDGDGRPALVDPAVYYGHREADLAFSRLFGGLSPRAISAYLEAWPVAPGHEVRADIYNLYHLLNHAVLFGTSYFTEARTIAVRYG